MSSQQYGVCPPQTRYDVVCAVPILGVKHSNFALAHVPRHVLHPTLRGETSKTSKMLK